MLLLPSPTGHSLTACLGNIMWITDTCPKFLTHSLFLCCCFATGWHIFRPQRRDPEPGRGVGRRRHAEASVALANVHAAKARRHVSPWNGSTTTAAVTGEVLFRVKHWDFPSMKGILIEITTPTTSSELTSLTTTAQYNWSWENRARAGKRMITKIGIWWFRVNQQSENYRHVTDGTVAVVVVKMQ